MEPLFYALKVQRGKEQDIKSDIETAVGASEKLQKIFDGVLLMPKVVVKKKGTKEAKERYRYMSYVYIQGDCTDPALREVIAQVEGVFGWIGAERPSMKQEPIPIKAEELNKMFSKVASKQSDSTRQVGFKKGDKIIVKDPNSLFKGSDGQIREIIHSGEIVKSLKINRL